MGIFCPEYYLLSAFGSLQEPKRQSHKFSMQITISKITLPTSIVLAHIALVSIVSASSRKQSFEDFPSSSFFFYTNVRTAILMQCSQLYGKLLFYPWDFPTNPFTKKKKSLKFEKLTILNQILAEKYFTPALLKTYDCMPKNI